MEEKLHSVVGIHLSGATSHKTSLVRGSFGIKSGVSGLLPSQMSSGLTSQLSSLERAQKECFSELPIVPEDPSNQMVGPFVIESLQTDLGPVPDKSADEKLIQSLHELGSADFYVFDAPLTLPPCTLCNLQCPGVSSCEVPEVQQMSELWRLLRKSQKRIRAPQPYIDRYFEFFSRNVLEGHSLLGEFDSALGSNRAPLSARARFLKRGILKLNPKAKFLETHSAVSSLAWHAHFNHTSHLSRKLKAHYGGRVARRIMIDSFAGTGRVVADKRLSAMKFAKLWGQSEVFLAVVTALTVRNVAAGELFLQTGEPFMQSNLLQSSLLPKACGLFIEPEIDKEGPSESEQN